MTQTDVSGAPRAFDRLRQLMDRPRPKPPERCDMCARELAVEHEHLLEPAERHLTCVCGACAVLFSGQANERYRRVPRRVRVLADFRMTDGQWDALRLPINLAFFYYSTPQARVIASYPSPAGATESLLSLESWADIQRENPVLRTMQPDVEALLVNRVGYARELTPADYFLVPADQCYKLVGLIRTGWTGLSGGTQVWRDIGRFFTELKERGGVGGGGGGGEGGGRTEGEVRA